MTINYSSMYGTKKKRAVDPNAPPRPNLLSHEKTLKDTKSVIEQQHQQIQQLMNRVASLERKLENQTSYLTTLHQKFQNVFKR
jgi:molecular chaperone GrpE (heat shock protein)